jgi:hypothetical protein
MANCLVYYDKGRATSWVGDAAGEILANELKGKGFDIVSAEELRQRLKNAVRNNEAGKYVVVFARDVVPHDVFDVMDENNPFTEVKTDNMRFRKLNIVKPLDNSLLMKFIYNGGVVVWLGDIPFWYVTNPKDGMDKLDLWLNNGPLTILKIVPISPISMQPAISVYKDFYEVHAYPSQKPVLPVLYLQNYVQNIERSIWSVIFKKLKISNCGNKLIPLAKADVTIGMPYPLNLLLPIKRHNGQVVGYQSIKILNVINPRRRIITVDSKVRRGKFEWKIPALGGTAGVSIGGENGKQVITETVLNKLPIYPEAYSSWIKCMGKGLFIRLWDYEIRLDKDGNATVTEEEVRGMARKIRSLLKKLGIKCPQHLLHFWPIIYAP